jgi:hypothetical protein
MTMRIIWIWVGLRLAIVGHPGASCALFLMPVTKPGREMGRETKGSRPEIGKTRKEETRNHK